MATEMTKWVIRCGTEDKRYFWTGDGWLTAKCMKAFGTAAKTYTRKSNADKQATKLTKWATGTLEVVPSEK